MSEFMPASDPSIAAMEAKYPNPSETIIEPMRDTGRPRVLHPLRVGQLSMLLAFGFSHREAANWLECGHATVSRYMEEDEQLRNMVERFARLAQVHPLTRLFRARRTSWRASVWLIEYFDAKRAAANSEEAREALTELVAKVNRLILADDYLPGGKNEEGNDGVN